MVPWNTQSIEDDGKKKKKKTTHIIPFQLAREEGGRRSTSGREGTCRKFQGLLHSVRGWEAGVLLVTGQRGSSIRACGMRISESNSEQVGPAEAPSGGGSDSGGGRQRGMGEGWDHLQSSSGLSLCPQGPSHPPTGSAWEPSACIPHMAPFRCVVPPLSRETSLPSFTRGGNRGCRVSPLVKSRA